MRVSGCRPAELKMRDLGFSVEGVEHEEGEKDEDVEGGEEGVRDAASLKRP